MVPLYRLCSLAVLPGAPASSTACMQPRWHCWVALPCRQESATVAALMHAVGDIFAMPLGPEARGDAGAASMVPIQLACTITHVLRPSTLRPLRLLGAAQLLADLTLVRRGLGKAPLCCASVNRCVW